MRHRKTVKTLDRGAAARKALLRNLATSLVLYEKIKTTRAKAKAVQSMVERVITKGRANSLHTRRELLKVLFGESTVKKVLEDLSPRYKDRSGGYTRISRIGRRAGDAAEMVQIEFV